MYLINTNYSERQYAFLQRHLEYYLKFYWKSSSSPVLSKIPSNPTDFPINNPKAENACENSSVFQAQQF